MSFEGPKTDPCGTPCKTKSFLIITLNDNALERLKLLLIIRKNNRECFKKLPSLTEAIFELKQQQDN